MNDTIDSHARQRGISRHFKEVATGIIEAFGQNVVIFSPEPGDYSPARHIRSVRFRGSRRLGVHDILASILAYREKPRVFFSPYYGRAWTKAAEIFTVYDLIPELFSQYYSNQRGFIAERKHCFERAARLIAISQNTARDIVTCYPHLAAGKIVSIHLGVDDFFFENNQPQSNYSEKPFFLYVGHRASHKNFLRLLIAFGQSGLAQNFNLRVISPVAGGFTPAEINEMEKYHFQESVQLVTAVSEEALRESYTGAVALVYPSEYEGFGLPILEAMAGGTVVATSNTSSMPEVGGKAAFYFDPYQVDSIAKCLWQIAELPAEERQSRVDQGIAWARTFTWGRCRQQTVDVIRQFI
ncbi:MAG: glycosyltransferase family 1 protein [Chloroflexota bacterium]